MVNEQKMQFFARSKKNFKYKLRLLDRYGLIKLFLQNMRMNFNITKYVFTF